MKIIIIALILAVTQARVVEQDCDGIIVHNIKHEVEELRTGLESPYQLAIDYDTNMLFFSYTANLDDDVFKSAFINLKTDEFKIITGIAGGFANSVDSKEHRVFLGGRDGLYNFNFDTKDAQHIVGTNHNIWQLFYKDQLYYTTYPQEEAYVFKNGKSESVPELIGTKAMLIALDNDKNIYFSNSSGLFIYKNIKKYTMQLGEYNLNGFTSDINGNLFFSTPDGIYSINSKTKNVEKLANINNIYGLAIESDGNIIYASQDGVMRLKPTKTYCAEDEKKI